MLLLVGSAILSVATGGLADSLVIVGAIGINNLIGFVTESNTEKIICSLQRVAHPRAMVVRDDCRQEVAAEELVPLPATRRRSVCHCRSYRKLDAYGHVGRIDIDLPWEKIDKPLPIKKQTAG
jgi:hypothetical protein